jgi:hypothetical protein
MKIPQEGMNLPAGFPVVSKSRQRYAVRELSAAEHGRVRLKQIDSLGDGAPGAVATDDVIGGLAARFATGTALVADSNKTLFGALLEVDLERLVVHSFLLRGIELHCSFPLILAKQNDRFDSAEND